VGVLLLRRVSSNHFKSSRLRLRVLPACRPNEGHALLLKTRFRQPRTVASNKRSNATEGRRQGQADTELNRVQACFESDGNNRPVIAATHQDDYNKGESVCTQPARQDATDALTVFFRNMSSSLASRVLLDRLSHDTRLQLVALHPRQLPPTHFRHAYLLHLKHSLTIKLLDGNFSPNSYTLSTIPLAQVQFAHRTCSSLVSSFWVCLVFGKWPATPDSPLSIQSQTPGKNSELLISTCASTRAVLRGH
jgi:hypothetical protein